MKPRAGSNGDALEAELARIPSLDLMVEALRETRQQAGTPSGYSNHENVR